MKFGGTSVAGVDRLRRAARIVCESRRAGDDVVVVVSAMAGETDRLLALGREVLPVPAARELDVLAASGEQVSCALLAMAILACGEEACSLLGYQLPLLTDSSFGKARIYRVETRRVREALSLGQIPVIAGFQGTDVSGDVTTLGRGGSDTTAVALAAALRASVCEIYTDVAGVYTADPRVCPESRMLRSIGYEEMLMMASLGARVLQLRSVEIAMKYGAPIHVRSTFSGEEGTWVEEGHLGLEARALCGIACDRGQAHVALAGVPSSPEWIADLTSALSDLNICADMLGHAAAAGGARADIALSLPEADLGPAREALERLIASAGCGEARIVTGLAKVSLIGIGIQSDPRILSQVCRALVKHGLSMRGLAVNELRISFLVAAAQADLAVRVLHETFGLSRGGAEPASP